MKNSKILSLKLLENTNKSKIKYRRNKGLLYWLGHFCMHQDIGRAKVVLLLLPGFKASP